jgi:putative FmdB family regulatory protein
MMLHDYKCSNCQNIQEANHKWNEKPEINCNNCGTVMDKQIGSAGFKLKGDGWFRESGYKGK